MLAIKDTFHKLITFPNRMCACKQNKKNNINYLRMYECEHKRNSKCWEQTLNTLKSSVDLQLPCLLAIRSTCACAFQSFCSKHGLSHTQTHMRIWLHMYVAEVICKYKYKSKCLAVYEFTSLTSCSWHEAAISSAPLAAFSSLNVFRSCERHSNASNDWRKNAGSFLLCFSLYIPIR